MTKISKKKRDKAPLNPVQLTLALRLRSLREAREPAMTQEDLAKLVGRNKASVSHWESGENEPSTAILIQLATLYGVSVNYLLGLEDRPSKPQPHAALEVHTVPVLSEADMMAWTVGEGSQQLVTCQPYDKGTAAAIRVDSAALASVCPMGAYAVVAQRERVDAGEVVVVAVDGETVPLFRKVVRDGSNLLLIADDLRYPTVRLDAGVRLIGRVVETIEFRTV